MQGLIDLIKLVPIPVQIAVAGMLLGGAAFAGLETRYVNASQFEKSYILNLKSAIREIMRELDESELSDRERTWLEEELEALIDELCYETPDDRLCVSN